MDAGAIAAMPFPTSAGVFGIERTTTVPSGSAASIAAVVMPAAIDNRRGTDAAARPGNTSGAIWGFTASTASTPATGASPIDSEGCASLRTVRRSADGSTTWISSAAAQPVAIMPPSRASAILPPPMNWSFGLVMRRTVPAGAGGGEDHTSPSGDSAAGGRHTT